MALFWWLVAYVVLSGSVRVEGTREPVSFAVVEIVGQERRAVATRTGHFVFRDVRPGHYTLHISALGFRPVSVAAEIRDVPVHIDISLTPEPVALPALISEARIRSSGRYEVPGEEIRQAPRLLEADVLRGLAVVPAVQFASDYSTAIYLRGGTPDQTSIAIDGMPLLAPYHLGGGLTAVDPDAVASVDVYAGGLPAHIGDRSGGHIDIWTREGARDRARIAGGVGLASARFSAEGPLGASASYLLAGRRSYFDLLSRAAVSAGLVSDDVPYSFADGHAKTTFHLGASRRLTIAAYLNREQYRDRDVGSTTLDAKWGSQAASVSYQQVLRGAWIAHVQAAISSFSSDAQYLDAAAATRDSLDGETRLRIGRVAATIGSADTWQFGAQLEQIATNTTVLSAGADILQLFPRLDVDRSLTTLALYGQREIAVTRRVQLRAGVRSWYAQSHGWHLMPRGALTVDAGNESIVSLSGGTYVQPLLTLRNEEASLARVFAYDISMPVEAAEPLGRSADLVLGYRGIVLGTTLAVDVYHKWLSRLWLPRIPTNAEEAAVLTMERGNGRAITRGVEVSALRSFGPYNVTLTYAGTHQRYTAFGSEYTPSFHRAHNLGAGVVYNSGSKTLGVRAVLQSGLPFTPAADAVPRYRYDPSSGQPYVPSGTIVLLGAHNSARLPGYWRIDAAARTALNTRIFGRRGVLRPYVDIYNVFNSRNPLWGLPRAVDDRPRLEYGPQLPLLPTIGVEWNF